MFFTWPTIDYVRACRRRVFPDELYTAENPAPGHEANKPTLRQEPFAAYMSRLPKENDPFRTCMRWKPQMVEVAPADAGRAGTSQPAQPESAKVLKVQLGGLGLSPVFDAYFSGETPGGRLQVFGQV